MCRSLGPDPSLMAPCDSRTPLQLGFKEYFRHGDATLKVSGALNTQTGKVEVRINRAQLAARVCSLTVTLPRRVAQTCSRP